MNLLHYEQRGYFYICKSEILNVVATFSEINLLNDSSVTEKGQTNRP